MVIMPIQDNVIIKLPVEEKEKKTNSGIIISTQNTAKELPEQGEVVAVGSGRLLSDGTLIAPMVNSGDVVLFNKFAGTKITSNNTEYLIIKENDILAIIKE